MDFRNPKIVIVTVLAIAGVAVVGTLLPARLSAGGAEEPRPVDDYVVGGHTIIPLEGPIVVAIQPGHWRIDELPEEHSRRKRGIGAVHGETREVDINLAVVAELVPMLEAEGWTVMVVPATVPPGLRADAFISIHADWGASPQRQGWKLAPPWRPSRASRELAEALRGSFRREADLVEDVDGITVGMRGYFGFSSHRYLYASSPYTPATLVELGFVTNPKERTRMVTDPAYYARIIHRGLESHFYRRGRSDIAGLVPQEFNQYTVGTEGAVVRRSPEPSSGVIRRLEPGASVRPVDQVHGWYEARFRDPGQIGWVAKEDLVPLDRLAYRSQEGRETADL